MALLATFCAGIQVYTMVGHQRMFVYLIFDFGGQIEELEFRAPRFGNSFQVCSALRIDSLGRFSGLLWFRTSFIFAHCASFRRGSDFLPLSPLMLIHKRFNLARRRVRVDLSSIALLCLLEEGNLNAGCRDYHQW